MVYLCIVTIDEQENISKKHYNHVLLVVAELRRGTAFRTPLEKAYSGKAAEGPLN